MNRRSMWRLACAASASFVLLAVLAPRAWAQATEPAAWATARQLADDGRHAESLEVIRVALARNPNDTGLLWLQAGVTNQAGDHEEAVRLYDALVAAHPGMADDVALDRAEALNWGGRHREAARLYRAALDDGDPARDIDAAKGLAFAEYWAGRSDLARQSLRNVPAGDDEEIEALRRRLDEERRPSLTVRYGSSHDSDDLDVRTGQVTYREPVGERDALDFTFRLDRVEDNGGAYDLKRMSWGHERVWSHAWQTHAYAGVVVEGAPNRPFLFDTWVTHRPLDALRFDLGLAREQVLTRDALDLEITYFTPALSVEWWMTRRWLARLAHRQSVYSDDNRTWLTQGGLLYRVLARRTLRLDVGADASHLASEFDLANGYYDPASYVEAGGVSELTWEPRPRWEVGVAGRLGRQKESGSAAENYYGVSGRAEVPLSRSFRLGLEAGSSNSSLSSASGYRRTSWGVSLTTGF